MCVCHTHTCAGRHSHTHRRSLIVHFSSRSLPSSSCVLSARFSAPLPSCDSLPHALEATSHIRDWLQVTSGMWADGLLCTTAAEWTIGRKGLQVRRGWELCCLGHRAQQRAQPPQYGYGLPGIWTYRPRIWPHRCRVVTTMAFLRTENSHGRYFSGHNHG